MNREKIYYIKIMIVATLVYGAFIVFAFTIFHKTYAGILASTVSMVAFYLILSFILNYWQFKSIDRYMSSENLENFDADSKNEIILSMNMEKAHNLVKQVLIDQKNLRIADENEEKRKFLVTYGATWNKWGEIILINLSEINKLKTKIELYSQRAYRSQPEISDEHRIYVKKIIEELNRYDLLNTDTIRN